MKFPKLNISQLNIKSKWIFYLVSILSFLNVLALLQYGYLEHVFVFGLISLLVFQYNTNMVFVLGIPLFLINVYLYVSNAVEGMRNEGIMNKKRQECEKLIDR